ncbi:NADH-quinone oxidoreductase subunit C [Anaerocolumna sp. MB42-C2]|uniref:NADH-quinone oxidoreductase subunit C n=1 Tax=Anaerocolumna sp. MB42-C2 TaxID=3070997 RepID=UPI0027E0C147|nr:NADH-quinone oxidoreductase subunit C [Anaerocolumna sp. MB42-C2]WMJ86098.1 NADH-quinone oxidoreductase subunit C [Anaerocolumna sp. MB42-C2]
MEQQIKIIQPSELLAETLRLKNDGYRLVAITCTSKDGLEITYSFDKEYDFINLRLLVDSEIEVESISSIYSYAFLYENEIKELFGANMKDMAVDFNNNLYKIPVKTPFKTIKEEKV